jgi:polysaccharide pyruvyl transferase WcaK-like protein
MNICVCGYYGMGNFGDELFLHTWQQLFLEDNVFAFTPYLDFSQVDAVIVGGGDLITPYHFNAYYFPPIVADFPTWVYGVGIVDYYPEETWPEAEVNQNRDRLSKAKILYVRDEQSAAIARKHNFHHDVQVVPDIVFSYKQPSSPVGRFSLRPTIGVCVFSYDEFPLHTMVDLLVELSRQYHLVLLPVVNQNNNKFADMRICSSIREMVKSRNPDATLTLPGPEYDLNMTYQYLQAVDYLISFKLHPALVALRGGVPVFSLSRMSKVSSLLNAFGLDDFMCDYNEPIERMLPKISEFLQTSKQRLHNSLPLVRLTEKLSNACLQQLKAQMLSSLRR